MFTAVSLLGKGKVVPVLNRHTVKTYPMLNEAPQQRLNLHA
jgi:hypothetical protein